MLLFFFPFLALNWLAVVKVRLCKESEDVRRLFVTLYTYSWADVYVRFTISLLKKSLDPPAATRNHVDWKQLKRNVKCPQEQEVATSPQSAKTHCQGIANSTPAHPVFHKQRANYDGNPRRVLDVEKSLAARRESRTKVSNLKLVPLVFNVNPVHHFHCCQTQWITQESFVDHVLKVFGLRPVETQPTAQWHINNWKESTQSDTAKFFYSFYKGKLFKKCFPLTLYTFCLGLDHNVL